MKQCKRCKRTIDEASFVKDSDTCRGCLSKEVVLVQENNEPQPHEIAEQILSEYHFVTLRETGEVLWFYGGVYTPGGEIVIKTESEARVPDCSTHFVSEVLGHVQRRTFHGRAEFDNELYVLNLKNGLLDIRTGKFRTHSHEYLSRIQLPVEFDQNAKCRNFLKFLGEVMPDQQDRKVLLEQFASCLWRSPVLQKAYMFVGFGANGKSTYLQVVKALLGQQNVSSESIHNLANGRFSVAQLDSKLANIFPDISSEEISKTGILKGLIAGDLLTVERKFSHPFQIENYAKLFFSCNQLPQVYDSSDAWFRRWSIVQWPVQFLDGKADAELLAKITTDQELSGILNILLGIVRKLISKGKLSLGSTVQQLRVEWQQRADPLANFLERTVSIDPVGFVPKAEIYQLYALWCKANNFVPKSDRSFNERVKQSGAMDVQMKLSGRNTKVWRGISLAKVTEATEVTSWDPKEQLEKSSRRGISSPVTPDTLVTLRNFEQGKEGVQQ